MLVKKEALQGILLLGSALVAMAVLFGSTPAVAAPTPTSAADERTSNEVQSVGRLGPLTDLVIRRLLVSDQVAASKFGTSSPIDDPVPSRRSAAGVPRRFKAAGPAWDPADVSQYSRSVQNALTA